jgi:hypothetical protein
MITVTARARKALKELKEKSGAMDQVLRIAALGFG